MLGDETNQFTAQRRASLFSEAGVTGEHDRVERLGERQVKLKL